MQNKEKDIRWIQRFRNFDKALIQLQKFIDKKISMNWKNKD